jgi:glycosyltransferase involved in cell wall biosynthesis
MRKILHAISKGETGGAQSSLMSYISSLSSHTNNIMVGDDNIYLKENALKSGAKDIRTFSILSNPIRINFIFQILRIRRNIIQQEYNLIFTHSLIASFIIRISLLGTSKKTQYVVHGFTGNKNVPFIKRCVGLLLEIMTAHKVDKVIALTEKEKKVLKTIFKKQNIHIIPNTSYINENVERNVIKKTYKRQIVCLSRFSKPKLNDLIIEAFIRSKLRNTKDWELVFYGDGPDLEAAINQSKGVENIKFYPPVSSVKSILNKAEFLILMSSHEGMPMTMIEAFALGTNVLCSDIEELREFERYDMEYDVIKNNIESLTQKFTKLYSSGRPYTHHSENKENFNKYLSPDKFQQRIENFLCL